MTARKRLKRLVRARSARTGESYAAARRHLRRNVQEDTEVSEPTRLIEKPAFGYALEVPASWREYGRDTLNSSGEVGRFLVHDDNSVPQRGCLVFREPRSG